MSEELWFDSKQEHEIFLYSQVSRSDLKSTNPPVRWVLEELTLQKCSHGLKLTTHLHLMQRLEMSIAIPSFLHTHLWSARATYNYHHPTKTLLTVKVINILTTAVFQ